MKLSTHPESPAESTVERKMYKILPCPNKILHDVLTWVSIKKPETGFKIFDAGR